MQTTDTAQHSPLFQAHTYGSLDDWAGLMMTHPRMGKIPGKQFLGSTLGLSSMEVSLNSLAPGGAIPFLHGHRENEELYLFLAGEGQMALDGHIVELRAGSAVRVAPPVLRSWRNTGSTPLIAVIIQAKNGSLSQATAKDGFLADAPPAWPSP
jgi:mannose-6-phosphate isomerase-like protein (cupin superfamily)